MPNPNSIHAIKNKMSSLSTFIDIARPGYHITADDNSMLREIKLALDKFIGTSSTTAQANNIFDSIRDEYTFFQQHSSEASESIRAMAPYLAPYLKKSGNCRFFDFGCGDGVFTSNLLDSVDGKKAKIDFRLLEVDPTYLEQAKSKLADYTNTTIVSCARPDSVFDIGIANHSLYYVDDIQATLRGIHLCMQRGSKFLLTIANMKNDLVRLNEQFFNLHGKEYPKYVAEDVTEALSVLGIKFRKIEITSGFNFSDSSENRKRVLRFINNMQITGINRESEMLAMFDNYRVESKLCLTLHDTLFVIEK